MQPVHYPNLALEFPKPFCVFPWLSCLCLASLSYLNASFPFHLSSTSCTVKYALTGCEKHNLQAIQLIVQSTLFSQPGLSQKVKWRAIRLSELTWPVCSFPICVHLDFPSTTISRLFLLTFAPSYRSLLAFNERIHND